MRIAVLSDIHGNLGALEAVHRDLRARGADTVVNLGDSLSGPLLPRETAQYLMAERWLTIAGNHERQLLTEGPDRRSPSDEYARTQLGNDEFAWLRSLPASAWGAHDVFLCHGTPTSDVEYLLETVESNGVVRAASAAEVCHRMGDHRAPLVLCGHSHVPRVVRTGSGQLVVNPGSVGLPAYDDTHPFAHVIENGSPDARYCILEGDGLVGWSVCLLAIPYDQGPMAELARRRRRPDWEVALRTGYMGGA